MAKKATSGEYPGAERMRNLYEEKRLALRACARELCVTEPTIRAWLARAGVQTRSIAEAKRGQKPTSHAVEASVRSRRKRSLSGRASVGYKHRADGYVDLYIPDHPSASKGGYVREHRVVAEKMIGRQLRRGEIVHHKNGDRSDNRVENLEVMTMSEHLRLHYSERQVDRAGRFVARR
jgi:hypothetical protein